jgi:ABC-2 type transport system ATP-binding protein
MNTMSVQNTCGPQAAPTQTALEACDVFAGYGPTPVLRGLDLTVQAGEIYAMLGANGAGKTTSLSLFLGFVQPVSGRVRVNGTDPTSDPTMVRNQIAYIPESVALYEHLTAREHVAYLLHLAGQSVSSTEIGEALTLAGLSAAWHDRRTSAFSKGMRQKVAIALALARKVTVLLLDEPTSGLDPQATNEFSRILGLMRTQGVAVLMVTHDLLSAAEVADRIGFIHNGRLIEEVAAVGAQRFDVRALHRRYAQKGVQS